MSRYVRFHYSAGHTGTDVDEIAEFPDGTDDVTIAEEFEAWYENTATHDSGWENVSKQEAEEIGVGIVY